VRIGLEVRALHESFRYSGQGRYAYNLIREIARLDSRNEYHLVAPCPRDELDFPPLPSTFQHTYTQVAVPPYIKRQWLWEQAILPAFLHARHLNLFHFLLQMSTWWQPCRVVVTGYDAMPELFPEYGAIRRSRNYRLQKRAIRRAKRVIAISQSTKTDLVRTYGIDPRRISVVGLGVDPVFRPLPNQEDLAGLGTARGLPARFILSVFSLEPRKNTLGAIEAFARFVATGGMPHHLVLFGDRGSGIARDMIERAIGNAGLTGRVRLLGRVADEELAALYSLAEFFFFPSFYEGFGLPVLEAMSCGRAVIAANVSSMPEVVGDAGLLVDMSNPDKVASAMIQLASDSDHRRRLEGKAISQARSFSWDVAGRRVLQVYEQVVRD